MDNTNEKNTQEQQPKKVYVKPEITSEPLCSNMALCGCPPDSCKAGLECVMMGLEDYPS